MAIREMKCPKCGAPVSADTDVCGYCKARYVVLGESKACLFGEYVECNTFKKLRSLTEKAESLRSGDDWNRRNEEEVRIKLDFLKLNRPCRVCHIKNCPFFNIDLSEF